MQSHVKQPSEARRKKLARPSEVLRHAREAVPQQQAAEPLVISMIADGIWKQPMSMFESAWLAR